MAADSKKTNKGDMAKVLELEKYEGKVPTVAKLFVCLELLFGFTTLYGRQRYLSYGTILLYPSEDAKRLQNIYDIIYLISVMLGFIMAWLSDSYLGKYPLLVLGFILGIIGKIIYTISAVYFEDINYSTNLLIASIPFYCSYAIFYPLRISYMIDQIHRGSINAGRFIFFIIWFEIIGITINIGYMDLIKQFENDHLIYTITILICEILHFIFWLILSYYAYNAHVRFRILDKVIACLIFTNVAKNWTQKAEEKFTPYIAKISITLFKLYLISLPISSILVLKWALDRHLHDQGYILAEKYSNLKIVPKTFLYYLSIALVFPIMCVLVFPFLFRLLNISNPLRKLGFFYVAVMIGFIILAMILLIKVGSLDKNNPDHGFGQLRIFNAVNSSTTISTETVPQKTVGPLELFSMLRERGHGEIPVTVTIANTYHKLNETHRITLSETKSLSALITEYGFVQMRNFDPILKRGVPLIDELKQKVIAYVLNAAKESFVMTINNGKETRDVYVSNIDKALNLYLSPGKCSFIAKKNNRQLASISFTAELGAAYAIMAYKIDFFGLKYFQVVEPIPYYFNYIFPLDFIMTIIGYCAFVSCLHFAFVHSPVHIRASVFNLFIIVEAKGYLSIYILRQTFHMHIDPFFILIVLTVYICLFAIYVYVALKHDFTTPRYSIPSPSQSRKSSLAQNWKYGPKTSSDGEMFNTTTSSSQQIINKNDLKK